MFGGDRLSALTGGVVANDFGVLFGFLNVLVSGALAMVFAAVWIALLDRRPASSAAFGIAAGAVLVFAPLMGLAFDLGLVGSAELKALCCVGAVRGGLPWLFVKPARHAAFMLRPEAGGAADLAGLAPAISIWRKPTTSPACCPCMPPTAPARSPRRQTWRRADVALR